MRYGSDKTTKFEKTSNTLATLPSGSVLTIGGERKVLTSPLTVDTAITGLGGIESAIASNSFYFVYAVLNGGAVSLIGSLNETKPTSYDAFIKIGALSTDGSSNILDAQRGKSFQKCQTKILTGNFSPSVPEFIEELKFSNLEASRFYKLFFQAQIFTDPGANVSVEIFNADNGFTDQVGRVYQVSGGSTAVFTTRSDNYVFKNLSNAVSFYYSEGGSVQRLEGNTSKNETFATLCELPDDGFDNTIETNEWTP